MAPKINKSLLPLKLHYFLKYGGLAFFTFLPVVVRQKGVPPAGVGLMWMVTPISSITTNIVMSTLADAFKIHRIVFLSGLVVLSVSFTAVFLIPSIDSPPGAHTEANVSLHHCQYESDIAQLEVCPRVASQFLNNTNSPSFKNCMTEDLKSELSVVDNNVMNFTLHCNVSDGIGNDSVSGEYFQLQRDFVIDIPIEKFLPNICTNGECLVITDSVSFWQNYNLTCDKDYTSSCEYILGKHPHGKEANMEISSVIRTNGFWMIFLCLILIYGGNTCTTTMADTVCFHHLGKDRHKYGQQRLWGSLAWGIVGMSSGALVDYFSRGQPEVNYTPALIICATLLSLNLIISMKIKFIVNKQEKFKAKSVGNVFCSVKMIIFLLLVLVVGITMGIQWTFYFIVTEDVAYAWDPNFPYMKLLQGLLLGVDCILGEVPFLFLSAHIIKKLGCFVTFTLALCAFSGRSLLYSAVVNPWYFLPIDLLHGSSFGLFYPNMTMYASKMAPKGAQATVQGTVKSIFMAGVSLGALFGGLLMESVGGSKTFLYVGCFDAGFIVFYIATHFILRSCSTRRPQEELRVAIPENGHVTSGEFSHEEEREPMNTFNPSTMNDAEA